MSFLFSSSSYGYYSPITVILIKKVVFYAIQNPKILDQHASVKAKVSMFVPKTKK